MSFALVVSATVVLTLINCSGDAGGFKGSAVRRRLSWRTGGLSQMVRLKEAPSSCFFRASTDSQECVVIVIMYVGCYFVGVVI